MIQLPAPGEQDGSVVRRSVVEPGVRVLSETMPAARSATVGIVVPVGSRDETPRLAGASHFLEHLLFKGTARRSALEISAAIDAVGGDLNAFTGKEYTCYYARVLDREVDLAVDVLMDMVTASLVTDADVDSEREVVLEEIAMHDDDPAGVAHELFSAQVYAGSPLALPITGTPESMRAMTADEVRGHYRHWYRPANLSVVAAGGVDHERLVAAVARGLAGVVPDTDAAPVPRRAAHTTLARPPASQRARARDTEQVNIITGTAGLRRTDERRYALGVLNAVVGGGMSSRLFQEIREVRGLAYSVHSYTSMHSDAGAFAVYAGTLPAKAEQTLETIDEVLGAVAAAGITDAELARGKGQMSGSLVLALEESSARMTALADAEIVTGRIVPVAEALARIDAVGADEVRELAAELLDAPRYRATVGPEADAQAG